MLFSLYVYSTLFMDGNHAETDILSGGTQTHIQPTALFLNSTLRRILLQTSRPRQPSDKRTSQPAWKNQHRREAVMSSQTRVGNDHDSYIPMGINHVTSSFLSGTGEINALKLQIMGCVWNHNVKSSVHRWSPNGQNSPYSFWLFFKEQKSIIWEEKKRHKFDHFCGCFLVWSLLMLLAYFSFYRYNAKC